jgi:hypothetical protein
MKVRILVLLIAALAIPVIASPSPQQSEPPAVNAQAEPVAAPPELSSDSLKKAVADFRAAAKNPYEGKVFVEWGEFVTSGGDVYAPVLLYVPKSAGIPADRELTFFGVVQDASGKNVAAFEENVTLTATKDDYFVDKSLDLPGGDLRGVFGLADAGAPLAMISAEMKTAGNLDKDETAVSPLILSGHIYPMAQAHVPTEPYAFGGLKVVPKADGKFRPTDEFWYFVELRNPGLAEPPAPTDETVVLTETAEPMPKIQLKLDVEGTDSTGKKVRKSAAPEEVDAVPMKGVPGHYGIGRGFPLETFKPGEYKITAKVIDTVNKKSWTLSEAFRVVE